MMKFLYEIFKDICFWHFCYQVLNYIFVSLFKKYKKYRINQYRFFLKTLRQSKSLKDFEMVLINCLAKIRTRSFIGNFYIYSHRKIIKRSGFNS